MSESNTSLYVPIKLKALVIDDLVINTAGPYTKDGFTYPGDGKWSPQGPDYRAVVNAFQNEGPRPFFGGERGDAEGVLPKVDARPQKKDRGVYLHWVLPQGLRDGGELADMNYDPLPDQWLVVRFKRGDSGQQARAWFVDSGLLDSGRANMIVIRNGAHEAVGVGKAVPLESYRAEDFSGERTQINALGNTTTGSQSFTASAAANRNNLSFHDDLADLMVNNRPPADMTLSYLVLGWYRDSDQEPLARTLARLPKITDFKISNDFVEGLDQGSFSPDLRARFQSQKHIALSADVSAQAVVAGSQWRVIDQRAGLSFELKRADDEIVVSADAAQMVMTALRWQADIPVDQLNTTPCRFHGLLTQINYWSDDYKGPMLGYPGAPSARGGYRRSRPTLKIGVGASPEDALTALVAKPYDADGEFASLWKSLEAVAYHRHASLLEGWDESIQLDDVHQAAFRSVESGIRWSIQAIGAGPSSAAGAAQRPTAEQKAKLLKLNRFQAEVDAWSRAVVAKQQRYYDSWWRLGQALRLEDWDAVDDHDAACAALAAEIEAMRNQRGGRPSVAARQLRRELEESLEGSGLAARSEPAPRFWAPADPVILIQNFGTMRAHRSPRELPCRLSGQTVRKAALSTTAVSPFASQPEIQTVLQREFPQIAADLADLIHEARWLEGAATAAGETRPKAGFSSEKEWQTWLEGVGAKLGLSDDGAVRELELELQTGDVSPAQLFDLWRGQPWSPLFLDWRVTWYPDDEAGVGEAWRSNGMDLRPTGPPAQRGYVFYGRTLMNPLDGRLLMRPIDDLKRLLDSQTEGAPIQQRLREHMDQWRFALGQIEVGGLMGQSLDGIHAALQRRDVTRPLINPAVGRAWVDDEEVTHNDVLAAKTLTPTRVHCDQPAITGLPRAAPAAGMGDVPPETELRAGHLVIDELWMVDDFGQWADLRMGSTAGGSNWLVLNPHLRRSDDPVGRQMVMAPRFLHPTRLNFQFTRSDQSPWCEGDGESPIAGWVYYNMLDDLLGICDSDGQLVGELSETADDAVRWNPFSSQPSEPSPQLAELIAYLQQPGALRTVIDLIDEKMGVLQTGTTRFMERLVSRPFALVHAAMGLERFGQHKDQSMDNASFRVRLGRRNHSDDGLVAYFHGDGQRIIPAAGPHLLPDSAEYVGDAEADAVRVGFKRRESLLLLMDPHAAVHAGMGMLPAKEIRIPDALVSDALDRLEASFRVGPVLLPGGTAAISAPFAENGSWLWQSADNARSQINHPVAAPDFSAGGPVLAEGRMIFIRDNDEE